MNITQLQLLTDDIPATTAFYRDVLGLVLQRSDASSVTFSAGATELVFRRSDQVQPVYHIAFTIPSNKLEEAMAYIQARTGLIDIPGGGVVADFSNWHAESFYFYDNNGSVLEYIARHDLDNKTDLPFVATDICCISEIGLVTDDVPALAAQLNTAYAIPYFSKQPPQNHFTVMGDDEGLFIIVVKDRHWYPTGIPAGIFPTVIRFTDSQGKEQEWRSGF